MELMAKKKPSDKSLFRQAGSGNTQAWHAVVERQYPKLKYYLVKLLKDEHLASDFCQECFLRLFESIRNKKAPSNTGAWLLQVAYRLCLNYWNREKKKCIDMDKLHELTTPQEDPFEKSVSLERYASLQEVFENLPAQQVSAITLHYLMGYSYKECAKTMEVNVGTIAAHLNRARTTIKKKLTAMEWNGD